MTRIAIVIAASLALSACSFGSAGGVENIPAIPTNPSAVANTTVLDEQAALAVNLAYKGARLACEIAVDSGQLRGAQAARFQQLNRDAYNSVLAVDRAYAALNATSYKAALEKARADIAKLLSLATPGG